MDWDDWTGWLLADLNLRAATVDEMRRTVAHLTKAGLDWRTFRRGPKEARLAARGILAAKQRANRPHMLRKCQKALNLVAAYLSNEDEAFRDFQWDLSHAPAGRLEPYTPHEIERLRGYYHPEDRFVEARRRALLWICEYTGLRRSEIHRIRVADLDPDTSRIRVRPAKEGEPRRVPLHHDAWSPRRPVQAYLALHPGVPEFWVSRAGTPLGINMLSREMWDIGEATGVNVNFNRFRHTRATDLLARGVRLDTIGDLYGHRNPKSTRHYARNSLKAMEDELTRCKVPGFIRQRARPPLPVEPLRPSLLTPPEMVSATSSAL